MRKSLRSENGSGRWIDPVGLISTGGQVEDQALFVGARHDCVDVWLELAVVMVQGILFSALAGAPVIDSGGHAAHHEAAIRAHFHEIEAFDELPQALHGLENRSVHGCFSGWVSRSEDAIQIVET